MMTTKSSPGPRSVAARGDSKLLRRLTQLRKLQDETLDLVRNLEFKTADEEMQVLALKKYIQATLDLTAEIRALVRKP